MSTEITTLGVRITTTGAARGKRAVTGIDTAANRAKKSLFSFKNVLGGIGTAAAIRGLANFTDTWTELNNKIKLVTNSTSEQKETMNALFKVTQKTRTALVGNVTLFSRMSLATEGLGYSQEQLLRVTETLNKQVTIGGNNAQEAAAGLLQFSQGLASGKLQGDELRSVMENLLGVQKGLITGFAKLRKAGKIDFDVTKSNIRELASSGVLSTKLLLDALLEVSDETDKTFSKLAVTISQAMTRISNTFTRYIGEADNASGASKALVSVLNNVSENFTRIADTILYVGGAIASVFAFKGIFKLGSSAVKKWGAIVSNSSKKASNALAEVSKQVNVGKVSMEEFTLGLVGTVASTGYLTVAILGLNKRLITLKATLIALAKPIKIVAGGLGALALLFSSKKLNPETGHWEKFQAEIKKTGKAGETTKAQFINLSRVVEEYQFEMSKATTVITDLQKVETEHEKIQKKLKMAYDSDSISLEKFNVLVRHSTTIHKEWVESLRAKQFQKMSEIVDDYRTSVHRATRKETIFSEALDEHADVLKNLQKLREGNILSQEQYNTLLADSTSIYESHVEAIQNAQLDKIMEKISQNMESSITNAVMNMGQGLDSFKDLASSIFRDIASEMIRSQISKPIAGFLSGAVGSIFGGLLSFAGGGFTGSGSRTGGIDGQGGFPAILHPNETVTDHTKNNKTGGDTINHISVTYSPQVNALDPRTAAVVIAENAPLVVGIVRQAFNKTGQAVNI